MGTTWSVHAAGLIAQPQRLRGKVQAALDAVVAQMSHWEADSEISRYNRAPAGARVAISADFAAVIRCALEIAALTDGAFDLALGDLVEAWGFGPSLTVSNSIEPRHLGGWRDIRLDGNGLLQPGGVQLDLSAIAKGFAVDKLAAVLAAQGLDAFLVEVGGEMFGTGLTPEGAPWWAQIEWPAPTAAGHEILVALPGWAVATSGGYRRYFERDGQRFSHTLDPAACAPVASRVASVTVLAADCMRADAWATALTVMGEDRGLAFAAAHDLAALYLITTDAGVEVRASDAWDRLWA